MAGVGASVHLRKARRDLHFLTGSTDAIRCRETIVDGKETVPSISEDAVTESPAVESETAGTE